VAVFSDRDLSARGDCVAQALDGADAVVASLIFDHDQVQWLRERLGRIPIRIVFESALELMGLCRYGRFSMASVDPAGGEEAGSRPGGMPAPVRAILGKLAGGREEDRLAGYLAFLKVGPRLLRLLPSRRARDLRQWLLLYRYWNAGGSANVTAMLLHLARHGLGLHPQQVPAPVDTPDQGLVHPDHDGVFADPASYLRWALGRWRRLRPGGDPKPPLVGLLLYRKHVITEQPYIPQLIAAFEAAGLMPLPIFINGVEGHMAVRDWMTSASERDARGDRGPRRAVAVEAIVSTLGFPLVGGPAGSMQAGRREDVAQRILCAKNVPYIVSAPLLIQDLHSWSRRGIGGLQGVVLYALPELDGAIDPVPLGGLVGDRIYLIPERLKRLTGRVGHWIALHRRPPSERRIAIVLYGFPPGYGATGTAALLNVPESLMGLLRALQRQGYRLGELPADGDALLEQVRQADRAWVEQVPEHASLSESETTTVPVEHLRQWLGPWAVSRIEEQWGGLTGSGIRTLGDRFLLGGVALGHVWIGVQPPMGLPGDPMRLMYERDLTPHPQYAAFYAWLQHGFAADAVIHFGMHGTVEWLPGLALGNSGSCWPDILLGDLPNLYIYAANNPSESMLARRRGYGVLVSHNVPPYGRAGLYRELLALRELIAEYRADPQGQAGLEEAIRKSVADTGLEADCPPPCRGGDEGGDEDFAGWMLRLSRYLEQLESRLFSSGLHTLGRPPDSGELQAYLAAYFGDRLPEALLVEICRAPLPVGEAGWRDRRSAVLEQAGEGNGERESCLDQALAIASLLGRTGEEITNLVRGLNGEYIPAAPGGDLLRDGPGVLPTGRNIHALDPYRMPSPGALARGRRIAREILERHRRENGHWPETVALMLWGLDTIKTRGESLAILLELVGAEPVQEATGRIVQYRLRPLAELDHPRVDVLANLSGIFRDSFANVIELLDDLFQRAAAADEPPGRNAIRRHALQLRQQGVANPAARLFSNPAGDFGSLVNDRVTDASWESGEELAATWRQRNGCSYGRHDRGEARPEVLRSLLASTERVVQEIDSVEYGLTDIQEYYANTGALKGAAEHERRAPVASSVVESFSRDASPRELEELLRMEYRTKLLNPRWAEAMAATGSGGAYEISQRMTALLGWAGTTGFRDGWVYDQAADTYALDPGMAERLRRANPEAFRNVVGRLLEASSRGLWHTDAGTLERLHDLYDLTDAELEGVRA
jgi:magnesium chelatase subunit H